MIRKISFVLIHLAFLLILAGAVISACMRVSGTVRMHRGESADIFIRDDMRTIPFSTAVRLDSVAPPATVSGNLMTSPKAFLSDRYGRKYVVAVNSPAVVGDCSVYQISVDEDEALFGVTCDPWGTKLCFFGFLLFSVGASGLLVLEGKAMRGLLIALALTVALLIFLMERGILFQGLPPLLRSAWLPLHVALMAVAYTIFIMLTVISAVSLLPGAGRTALSALCRRLLMPGVLFLGLGICAGSVWADLSWGSYWNWDPKETWALVTFIVYSVPVHRWVKPLLNGRELSFYLVFAFLAVAMTWFGVNFLDSRHAY